METEEEFKQRMSTLTDSEKKEEFLNEYRKLVMKYRMDFVIPALEIGKLP